MIAVRDAVTKAKEYFKDVYSDYYPQSVRVEEVQLSDDGQYWLITIGYAADYREVQASYRAGLYPEETKQLLRIPREYKLVKLRADSGLVESMTIRQT